MIQLMNGERTEFRFQGTLLVPVANMNSQCNFLWLGTLNAPDNQVYVIAFKTNKPENFVPMMEEDLKVLQSMEQTDGIKQQINFIEKTLKEVSEPVFVKVPEQPMLDAAQELVDKALWKNGQRLSVRFTRDNTIYTSGVVYANKV